MLQNSLCCLKYEAKISAASAATVKAGSSIAAEIAQGHVLPQYFRQLHAQYAMAMVTLMQVLLGDVGIGGECSDLPAVSNFHFADCMPFASPPQTIVQKWLRRDPPASQVRAK